MGKLDRWLERSTGKDDVDAQGSIAADGRPPGAPDCTPKPTANSKSPRTPPARGMGGVSACCNLIRLLDPEELAQVHGVLVQAMREKKVRVAPLPDDLVVLPPSTEFQGVFKAAPKVPASASYDSVAELNQVLEEIRKLGSDATLRTKKPTCGGPAQSAPTMNPDAPAVGSGEEAAPLSQKMSRWLNKVSSNKNKAGGLESASEQAAGHNASDSATAAAKPGAGATSEDGAPVSGKLSRWVNRLNKKSGGEDEASARRAEGPEGAGKETPPLKFVQLACDAVRASWSSDTRRGDVAIEEEWEKLKLERASIEALMAMLYAVKQTPEHVSGEGEGGGGFCRDVAGAPGTPGGGGSGAPYANGLLTPGGGGGGVHGGGRAPPASGAPQAKPDPDALLAEFLAARREERVQETAQMIHDKKNPKKPDAGSGWRAGSPMASAATPTVPVRISLSRPPPPPPAPVMMGPPPENVSAEGGQSREDVINKEGGGFFFYPPGHPNYVPGGPASANLQLEGSLRSTVHPQERIAPHWSRAKFTAHGMPEVSCEARHATFGPLKEIQGRLVRCNPPLANKEITNEHQVRGNIVYIKRGGCSFTKKARVAQKAGAIGMVVANSDRETFGMSYTDDGEPFDSIQIPCVMISSDICAKLEACKQSPDGRAPWTCTFHPLVERQANAVYQETMQAALSGAAAAAEAVRGSTPSATSSVERAPDNSPGAQGRANGGGFMTRLKQMLP